MTKRRTTFAAAVMHAAGRLLEATVSPLFHASGRDRESRGLIPMSRLNFPYDEIVRVEEAMRERYAACATYEDEGACAVHNLRSDGSRALSNVLRFKTLFDRRASAFRFDLDDEKGPLVVLWRTSAGLVRVWSQSRRETQEHSLERAVMSHASISHRTAGVVAAMLLPEEISRIDATSGWTYEREEKERGERAKAMWRLSVGGAEVARTASVDGTLALRNLVIRDQSVVTDYETQPPTRSATTVEARISYTPWFDRPIEMGRFHFAPPK